MEKSDLKWNELENKIIETSNEKENVEEVKNIQEKKEVEKNKVW